MIGLTESLDNGRDNVPVAAGWSPTTGGAIRTARVIASGGARLPANTTMHVDKQMTALGATGLRILLKVLGTLHRLLYRTSGGHLVRAVRGAPVLLLTTTGRVSGKSRTWPVCYLAAGDGDLILVASAGGAPQHPRWYLNLRVCPEVTIQLGDRTWAMRARVAEGVERMRLWERVLQRYPVCASYQRRTCRMIPVVVLSPILGTGGNAPLFTPGGTGADTWACSYETRFVKSGPAGGHPVPVPVRVLLGFL